MSTHNLFWSKNKKNRFTPAFPSFFYIKVGFRGVYITRTCFHDVTCSTAKLFGIHIFKSSTKTCTKKQTQKKVHAEFN